MVPVRYGVAAREQDGASARSLRPVRTVAAAFGGTYLLALLASTFGVTGVVAELAGAAGGGQTIFLAGLVAVLALRARRAEEHRAAWWSFTAGAGAYLVGALVYQLLYRDAAVVPRPSWADAA